MDPRKLGAEVLGTFWLVLGGCGAAVLAAGFMPDTHLGIGCSSSMAPEVGPPARTSRSARATEIVAAAWRLFEAEGPEALTMRRLADELAIKAPSLYKHLHGKRALQAAIIEEALVTIGAALHRAVARPGSRSVVDALLGTYRRYGVENPNVYRLATGDLPRDLLPDGLEEWAGTPFFLATGEPHRAQALWAFAHGMVILEIDDRFADASDLDRTWRSGVEAFTGALPSAAATA